MTHDAHPWAVMDGGRPLFHRPGTHDPPVFEVNPELEALWRSGQRTTMQTSIPINEILCGRNETVLAGFPAECVDLTVTSPPYDALRAYKGYTWDFDATARELWRVTKAGGVVVWVVADATVDGSESGTSFRQALAFMALGFNLHDTMIYEVTGTGAKGSNYAYWQTFEYMFVFSKGRPATVNRLTAGRKGIFRSGHRHASNAAKGISEFNTLLAPKDILRGNVWRYSAGQSSGDDKTGHEAPFPEKLAEDHILSWSSPGDVVLDPFVGSGTTAKMAIKHHRQFIGIDISPEYCDLARRRISCVQETLFAQEAA